MKSCSSSKVKGYKCHCGVIISIYKEIVSYLSFDYSLSHASLCSFWSSQGIDLLAGVEAVISHLVVKEFQIPCAHAPAMSPFPLSLSLCPKAAAEEVGILKMTNQLTLGGLSTLIYDNGRFYYAM